MLIDPVLETVDRDIKLIDELGLSLKVAGKHTETSSSVSLDKPSLMHDCTVMLLYCLLHLIVVFLS